MESLRAGIDDLARIVELKQKMFEEAGFGHLLSTDFVDIVFEDYKRLYDRAEAAHFLIRVEGRIIGMAGGFVKSDIPYRYLRVPRYGFVGDVYTESTHRRQGYAKQLSLQVLEWFQCHEIDTVRLLASDAARPLYAALGFVPTDEMSLELK